jgi:hypothetical protein
MNRVDRERVYLEQQGYVRVLLADFLNLAMRVETDPSASPAFELEVVPVRCGMSHTPAC